MTLISADPIAPTAIRPRKLARRMLSNPAGMIGGCIVLALVICAVFAPQIAPFAPTRMGAGRPILAPSWAHLAGTDEFGRDMFSRIVYGARFTLLTGAIAVGISLVVGLSIGLIAAFMRGWVEIVLMRLSDVLFSFTETLIALACVAVLGPSLQNAMIAVGIAGIPLYARTAYAAALVEVGKPYFEGSIVAGASPQRLILTHLLPNVLPTMIVIATLGLSSAILAAAGLSFLGLGAQPPTPEWGAMLSGGRDFFNRAPWLMLYPGLAIAIVVLGFNLLGDGLRQIIDPKGGDR